MKYWVNTDTRLPDDSIEKFTGGIEGSWGLGVLIITKCRPQKGVRKLFGYFDADDDSFYSEGEKVDVAHWMISPPDPGA